MTRPPPERRASSLELRGVELAYSGQGRATRVLDDLTLRVEPGQIGCLLGPSGCGKTTALRAIAGFANPSRGTIRIDEQIVCGDGQWVPPERRRVGVVFQDHALFPHLDVSANVGFGLRELAPGERVEIVARMLELVGLQGMASRFPHQLSGGQQQRVALARALAPSPRVLLLDEPFSNLDPALRERLSVEVREILIGAGITALLVTHDQNEAFAMADAVGVMFDGRVVQWDRAWQLYHQPRTREVARFVGPGVFVPGVRRRGRHGETVAIELGTLTANARPIESSSPCVDAPPPFTMAPGADIEDAENEALEVLLRPDDVVHDDLSPVRAEVVRKAFRGADFLYTLRTPAGATLLALVPSHHDHAIGEQIGIRLVAEHLVTFPA